MVTSTKRLGGTRFRALAYTNSFMFTVPGIKHRCIRLRVYDTDVGSNSPVLLASKTENVTQLSYRRKPGVGSANYPRDGRGKLA